MANPVNKVVKRVKTVAREVRDIPTAVGTGIGAVMDYQQRGPKNAAIAKQMLILPVVTGINNYWKPLEQFLREVLVHVQISLTQKVNTQEDNNDRPKTKASRSIRL